MKRILTAAALAGAIFSLLAAPAPMALAKGKDPTAKLPILKGPVHKPFDRNGYHFTCDNRGRCGNWNVGSLKK